MKCSVVFETAEQKISPHVRLRPHAWHLLAASEKLFSTKLWTLPLHETNNKTFQSQSGQTAARPATSALMLTASQQTQSPVLLREHCLQTVLCFCDLIPDKKRVQLRFWTKREIKSRLVIGHRASSASCDVTQWHWAETTGCLLGRGLALYLSSSFALQRFHSTTASFPQKRRAEPSRASEGKHELMKASLTIRLLFPTPPNN